MELEKVESVAAAPINDTTDLESIQNLNEVQPRKILKETAFFFPHLKTDAEGNVKIQFTTPESLTTWKFMRSEEHTSELQSRGHLVCRLLLEKKKARITES